MFKLLLLLTLLSIFGLKLTEGKNIPESESINQSTLIQKHSCDTVCNAQCRFMGRKSGCCRNGRCICRRTTIVYDHIKFY